MKRIMVIVLALLALAAVAQVAQAPSQDLQSLLLRQKDAYIAYLELTNQVSNARIDAFVAELAKVRTVPALDSLRTANGIANPAPLPEPVKAETKKGGK
jgi:uncharacterized membrane protein